MYNLSELIKTDCCIDCGTNEKLREVVGKIDLPESPLQKDFGIEPYDTMIYISYGEYGEYGTFEAFITSAIPLTSINIDL